MPLKSRNLARPRHHPVSVASRDLRPFLSPRSLPYWNEHSPVWIGRHSWLLSGFWNAKRTSPSGNFLRHDSNNRVFALSHCKETLYRLSQITYARGLWNLQGFEIKIYLFIYLAVSHDGKVIFLFICMVIN